METVAVYSDADATATHVRAADQAVRIGAAPAAESYLRADRVIEAAVQTGADAVHPGYGFLAERADFARGVEEAGLAFVGPSSAAIAALGNKLAARRGAVAAGVPVVPGHLRARRGRSRGSGPGHSPPGSRGRVPTPREGRRGRWRPRDAARRDRRRAAGGPRGRVERSDRRVRRWLGVPRAGGSAGSPCRGPAARRQQRPDRGDRGARLLAPAAPPEARRGVAGARV